MKKLLFPNKQNFTEEQFQSLRDLGIEVIFTAGPETDVYDEMDFSDIDAVVCFKFFSYNPVERFPNLKYVHTTSTGYDQLPIKYFDEHGIIWKNCPGVHSVPISEFVIGSVLQMYKHSHFLKANQRAHKWLCDWGVQELYQKRVLVLSTGSIGQQVAKRFQAFDTTVIGLDKFPNNKNGYYTEVGTMDRLDEELQKADVVVNCIPFFPGTFHLIDQHCFDLMQEKAIFINITRGEIVDSEALLKTLQSGKLLGAAIDVWEQEPLPEDSPFWDIDRLLISCHNSFAGEGNLERIFACIYNDTKAWLESCGET